MSNSLSRRDFLRLSLLSASTLAMRGWNPQTPQFPPEDQLEKPIALGRVAADYVNIYTAASFKSERLGRYERDTLVPILACAQTALRWKNRNPHWYRTPEGFVHSAYIQCFENKWLFETLRGSPRYGGGT